MRLLIKAYIKPDKSGLQASMNEQTIKQAEVRSQKGRILECNSIEEIKSYLSIQNNFKCLDQFDYIFLHLQQNKDRFADKTEKKEVKLEQKTKADIAALLRDVINLFVIFTCHTRLSLSFLSSMDELLLILSKLDLTGVYYLNISKNCLTHSSMRLLSACTFNDLTVLNINDNRIGNKGLSLFSTAKWFRIQTAKLSRISVTSDGIQSFCRHCRLNFDLLQFEDNIQNITSLRRLLFMKISQLKIRQIQKKVQTQISYKYSLQFVNQISKTTHYRPPRYPLKSQRYLQRLRLLE